MNKIKLLVFSIITIFLIWIASWSRLINMINPLTQKTTPSPEVKNDIEEVFLAIDYNNSDRQTFQYRAGGTAYELLKAAATDNDIKIDAEFYDFGVFVKAINGFESSAEKAWIYFVNGKAGNIAADKMQLKPGDKVEWKYITPSE